MSDSRLSAWFLCTLSPWPVIGWAAFVVICRSDLCVWGGLNTPGANARGVCNGFRQKNGSLDRALSSNGSTPSWCFGGRVFADEVFTADA